ncbi:signal recognition particle-docking protein FtsY [Oceanispirochaeta crateris]|uniref:Signal recognition particle-docking protein FtsY n=1 Tax=Oceanispirochaeta crateris TaxID=2518645 RepID=A0A5C1QJH3_9SPIO|nr:signal recognition particle-docking protein FtsY [Oceanispirochaeta crateris]QEN07458.1 signal recognition particle-docking protein FtsY [Oceanispirochaeta crateris]
MFWKKKKKDNEETPKSNLGRLISDLFSKTDNLESFYNELEEMLISGDMGGTVAIEIVDELRERVKKGNIKEKENILIELRSIIAGSLKTAEFLPEHDTLNLFLVLGVNGVGKTTTIAKLSQYYKKNGFQKILFSAGDTFRAAAIDQLKIQGERTGNRVVAQAHGSDPGAVIYDSISSAKSHGEELILADTAGRMHNKANLVKELQKIDKIVNSNMAGGQYRKVLILDATTGQNGLQQAEAFNDAVHVDGVILTKYDATARGGLIVAISRKLNIPIAFVGHGEGLDDLSVFDPESYLNDLLALK